MQDPRFDLPLYGVREAARLARIPPKTLMNWIAGYRYRGAGGRLVRAQPVIAPTVAADPTLALFFANLMETVALARFRASGVPMQRVRKALDYAAQVMNTEHPLINQGILTDGADLFWRYEERAGGGVELVNITKKGQKVFPEAVTRYLREIEWGPDSFAMRWWPNADGPRKGLIVVDPRRAFGAPVVARTGIRTEDVFDRFSAGESIEDLVSDYGLTVGQVEAAIRTEAQLLEPLAA